MEAFQDKELNQRLAQWSILGRLTTSLFHEINNPMQAIQGAMSLALEELSDTEAVQIYLSLSLRESDRVLDLISRARRLFNPESIGPQQTDANMVVRETALLAAKEMSNKRIKIDLQLAITLPPAKITFSELALALLCPLFTMSDYMSGQGHTLTLASRGGAGFVWLELSGPVACFPPQDFPLPVCREVVGRHEGLVRQRADDSLRHVEIALPTFQSQLQEDEPFT